MARGCFSGRTTPQKRERGGSWGQGVLAACSLRLPTRSLRRLTDGELVETSHISRAETR